MKRKKGFTLVEIMIVVLIIGLLAALAIPSFIRARRTSRTNTCINNLRQIDSAKDQWAMESKADPATADPNGADKAAINTYIKGGNPLCPLSDVAGGGAYNYMPIDQNPICLQATGPYGDTTTEHPAALPAPAP